MSKFDQFPITRPAFGGRGDGTAGGATLSCDTTSKAAVLPTAGDGNRPKYVRIATSGTGYFRLNAATTVAVTTDAMFAAGWVEVWPTNGATHFAYASASGTTVVQVHAIELG